MNSHIPLEDALESVGPGWEALVREAYERIAVAGASVLQAKEKWGGLRIYCDPRIARERPVAARQLDRELLEIEERSLRTCEICGRAGEPHPSGEERRSVPQRYLGWIKTLCPEHTARRVAGEPWWSMIQDVRPPDLGDLWGLDWSESSESPPDPESWGQPWSPDQDERDPC